MEIFTPAVLQAAFVQIGIGVIFLYLFMQERNNAREDRQQSLQHRTQIESTMSEVIRDNTKAMEGVRNSNENLQKAVESLTENVYDVIRRK